MHACFCIFVYMPFCLRGHTFFNSKLCVSLWEMALLHDTSVADFLLIRPNLLQQYVRSEWSQIRLTHELLTQDCLHFPGYVHPLMESNFKNKNKNKSSDGVVGAPATPIILKHGRTRSNLPLLESLLLIWALLPCLYLQISPIFYILFLFS